MLQKTLLTFLLLFTSGSAAADSSFIGRCLLEIDGRKFLNGRCPIYMGAQGYFMIGSDGRTFKRGYFASLNPDPDNKNQADAYWNSEPEATHAHSSLGKLIRRGACWERFGEGGTDVDGSPLPAEVKVCAWR
jgi:hypothetical protein